MPPCSGDSRASVRAASVQPSGSSDRRTSCYAPTPSLSLIHIFLLNINATFYDQVRRDDGDIERLWDLFAVALAYADQPTEQTEAVFRHAYDSVLQQRHASWNVTMGLFWIRPYSYVNLSKRDRWFLALPDRMPSSVPVSYTHLCTFRRAAAFCH